MRLGYVRPSPWYTARKQIAALTGAGVAEDRIYVEGREGETLDEAIRALEPGDELCLSSADRLVNRRQIIGPTLDRIHAAGAVTVAVDSGERSTGYQFALDAIAGLARDRTRLTPAQASAMGKMGGRPAAKPLLPIAACRALWKDLSVTNADALAQMGVTSAWAYRQLGPRGAKAGRPRKSKRS